VACGGIARVNSDGTVTEFEAGQVQGLSKSASPADIIPGPHDTVWFSEPNLQRSGPCGGVARFDLVTDTASQRFACTTSPFNPRTSPLGIASDANGHIWFAEQGDGCGGCLGAPGGVAYLASSLVTFPSNSTSGFTPYSIPTGIASGADLNMWFTESANPGAIARVNPDGSVTELTGGASSPDSGLSANGAPNGIVKGPDGNVWFTESADPGRVGFVRLQSPAVTAVTANAGPTAGGNVVTITGPAPAQGTEGGFLPGEQVEFGTALSPTVTYVSPTELQAVAPAESAGIVDVRVGGVSGWTPRVSADLYAFGPPAVTSVGPDAGPVAGGNTVTINGSGFVPGATVSFGATPAASVTFVSRTLLRAVAPAGTAGAVDVTVTTAGGSSPATSADLYAYGPPSVTGLAPTAGPTAGGNVVVITGSGFTPKATVEFGITPSASITFDSSTQLEAVAPAKSAGAVHVRVRTSAGTSPATAADTYTYVTSGHATGRRRA
jgi:streptogramin lyase